jgi:transcriptional regulator with XRE-family HTH domain
LPCCEINLKGVKPRPYKENPITVGDHLRKRRYALGLFQKDVAQRLGISLDTLLTWETNKKEPSVRYLPKIIKFLGYDPFPEPCTLGGRLLAVRRRLGLSQEEMAKALRLDEGTVRLIEVGHRRPSPDTLLKIDRAFAAHPPA